MRATRQSQNLAGLAQAFVNLDALQFLLLFEIPEEPSLRCFKRFDRTWLLKHPIVVDRLAASPDLIARAK